MENASKALIMAGGILIAILVMSLFVYLIVSFGATSDKIHDQNAQTQITEFNAQFTKYQGRTNITIYDIVSVANLARENNKQNFQHQITVKLKDKCERFDELQEQFKKMQPHIWGVSTQGSPGSRMEHVEFTIHYADDEKFIRRRLEREKRCGTVEHIDDNTSRFSVDVFDSSEVIPWIRTFICRIVDIQFSNKELENQFKKDIEDMNRLYGIGGDE